MEKNLRRPVAVAVLKGVLAVAFGEVVNYVNAEWMAEGRGFEVVRSTHSHPADYPHLVRVTVSGEAAEVSLAGALVGERDPRVVQFEGFQLEFRPAGRLLVMRNCDVPGVVGRLGTILGEAGVNIADIHFSRRNGGGDAVAVLRLDSDVAAGTLARIAALPEVARVQVVDLGL